MTETRRHKKNLKERGITLIALVITIIVLLILAGVALSALTGDSGILNNAESAKEKTNLANAEEQVKMAVQGALTEAYAKGERAITREQLKNELESIVGTENKDYTLTEGEAPWTVKVGEYEVTVQANGKIEEPENPDGGDGAGDRDTTTLPSVAGKTTPWLPTGFSQVAGTTLDNGLTITNATGLQNYVWIEVPNNIKQTITVDSAEKTISLTEATTDKEIELVLHAYASSKENATKGNYRSNAWTDEWYDSTGSNVATDANKEDTAGCGMTYEQYQTAYSNMLNSIKEYGGFWLAQYEAGIAYEEGNRTGDSERISNNPTSANYAKDQYPYNNVYCSEAQKIANADSVEGKYTSSLPFGIQWDLVCKFLEVKKAKTYDEIATNSTWGNYSNIGWTSSANSKCGSDGKGGKTFTDGTFTKSSGNYLLTTGAITTINSYINASVEEITLNTNTNAMNIYDFAGNVWEWTLEYSTESAGDPCVYRGGCYSNVSYSVPAANRLYNYTTFSNEDGGFRSTLY